MARVTRSARASGARAATLALSAVAAACGSLERGDAERPSGDPVSAESASVRVALPDPSGWGTHVLAVATAPDGVVWVGTYGLGIYRSRDSTGAEWSRLTADDSAGISWDFVHAFAFAGPEVWYGTIGNGWGMSRDGGRTWTNWTFDALGPRWQYVAPGGLAAAGDTVYVATADGLRVTADDGATWRDVVEAPGLPSRYLLSLEVETRPGGPPLVRVTHLRGVSESPDGGRTWSLVREAAGDLARGITGPYAAPPPGELGRVTCPDAGLAGRVCRQAASARRYADPGGGAVPPSGRAHFWFRRPIGPADNRHMDQTYPYGSTMGGNFQPHQGVEFNDPEGTPILAVGDGAVAFAGPAEAGSNTIAILHGRRLEGRRVWSTYYHASALLVRQGEWVRAGDTIARVGSTGRATNDHLHLEIHVTPDDDVRRVVDPAERYPPYTGNPQLWVEPLPGTGAIAGRVLDAGGRPVPGARVYGTWKPHPHETPHSFAETYGERAHPDPVFGEHFAIGDVPAGEHVLGVEIDGVRVLRKVRVEPGRVTEVELRP